MSLDFPPLPLIIWFFPQHPIWPWNMDTYILSLLPSTPSSDFLSEVHCTSTGSCLGLATPTCSWAKSIPTLEFYYLQFILPGLLFRENYFCFPFFLSQTSTHQWDHSWNLYIEEQQQAIIYCNPTGFIINSLLVPFFFHGRVVLEE